MNHLVDCDLIAENFDDPEKDPTYKKGMHTSQLQ